MYDTVPSSKWCCFEEEDIVLTIGSSSSSRDICKTVIATPSGVAIRESEECYWAYDWMCSVSHEKRM